MPKFKKKPVVIEAHEFTGTVENYTFLEQWSKGACFIRGTRLPAESRELAVNTLEGEMRATVGDWVIRGVEGEFYFCKPTIFHKTYDRYVQLCVCCNAYHDEDEPHFTHSNYGDAERGDNF